MLSKLQISVVNSIYETVVKKKRMCLEVEILKYIWRIVHQAIVSSYERIWIITHELIHLTLCFH